MKRKMIVLFAAIFASLLAVPVLADPVYSSYYDFYAGQTIDVGDIGVGNDATNLYIHIAIAPSWQITESHVAVAMDLSGIPQTKSGNPKVGKFPYKGLETFTIELSEIGAEAGDTLIIAVHSVVKGIGENCGQQETAWGTYCRIGNPDNNPPTAGDFPGNNWATYLIYIVTA